METTPVPNASVSVLKNSNDESVAPDANKAGAGSVSSNQTEDPPPEDIPSIDGKGSRGRKIDDKSRASAENSTPHPPLDGERVDKAEAFLRNEDIRDVSDADKRAYLRSRAGMIPEEIDAAMERAARKGRIFDASDGNSRDRFHPREGGDRDRGRSSQRYYEDQSRDRRGGIRSRDPNQRHRDDYGNARRPPPPNYPTANYNEAPTRMHPAPGTEREGATPSPSFLPAWAGGFSLGIFCLAALRWLNGGDFVLFPSPTASESGTLGSAKEALRSSANEGDTDESDSRQHEDDDLQGGDVGYDEFEGSDGDEGLGMILEGTANAQKFHPEETQPSLNELALEIRALTSAVHSYRDEQERANRAVSAQVGKGMTDDAMEFLRQKKSDEVPTCKNKATDLNEKVTSITLLLSEVSGDLSTLGQSILQDQGGDCKPVQPEESPDSAEQPSKDGNKDGISSKQIEELMQKIQKVVDIVKSIDSTEKGGFGPRENESNDCLAIKKETESRSVESTAAPVAIEPVADADTSQQNENSPQHQGNSDSQSNEVEDALKILSSSNEAKELEAGAQILYLYLLNVSKNPSFPRHRKIYTNNNNFRSKIGNLTGARELLSAVGFAERAGHFEWARPDDAETKSRLSFALAALEMMKSGAKSKDEAIVQPSDPIEIPTGSSGSLAHAAHAAVSVSVEKALDLN